MRKFFILTLMVVSLLMIGCVEKRNRVILEKFVPITASDNCTVKVGGDTYYAEGTIDLAFTFDYQLAFQITNYIPSSVTGDGGSGGAPISGNETNYFYAERAEIDYEWDPKPQADGRKLTLDQSLWNKKTKKEVHGIVVSPDGGQAAGFIHIFEEAQAKDLLKHVNDIDWIASPLIVKVKLKGELADGTNVWTNTLNFNIIPTFGTTIQQGSVYVIPEGGFQDEYDETGKKTASADKVEYDAIMASCFFQDPLLGGCFYGQDASMHNCYAGDTEWERYIVESNGGTYIPGYAAAGVVEYVYNTLKKNASETGYYACCPGTAPEAPEEEEDAAAAAAGGAGE